MWVSYHYGFSADLGGGEYQRVRPPIADRQIYKVRTGGDLDGDIYATIMAAVARWRTDKAADAAVQDAVIEVLDSGVYAEAIDIALDEGDHLELRAAPGTRPVILLLDRYANRPDAMRVYGTGQPNGTAATSPAAAAEPPLPQVDPGTGCLDYPNPPMPTFVLDGFLVTGRSLLVTGPVARVTIRHCTLVPGWSLECDCTARRGEEPSIELTRTPAKLVVDHSIIGSIQVTLDEPPATRSRSTPTTASSTPPAPPCPPSAVQKAVMRTPPSGCGGARSSARSWPTSSRSATTPSSSGCCGWPAASRDVRDSAGSSRGRGRRAGTNASPTWSGRPSAPPPRHPRAPWPRRR